MWWLNLLRPSHKFGIEVGFYVSLGDKHFGCTSTPDPMGQKKLVGNRDIYFPALLGQIRELFTNYGKISEIWFKGVHDPFGFYEMDSRTMNKLGTSMGDSIHALVKKLQLDAIVMGWTRPDLQWYGSEQRWAVYPLWAVVNPKDWETNYIPPYVKGWVPADANIHTRNSWFWRPGSDSKLRSVNFLKKVYFESIGRGANLLINMTSDTSGLIPIGEVNRLHEFGQMIQIAFSNPLESTDNLEIHSNMLLIKFKQKQTVNLIVMNEAIKFGQHIKQYMVEAFTDGNWNVVNKGESIGVKRIVAIDPVEATKMRLMLFSDGYAPIIKKFIVYNSN